MKPNAAKAGMVRLGASLLALLALAIPALAGDRALVDIIGYSEDARYFAFEEFGIQDGSGFAYSSIYIVDLDTDSWVVGTPIREQADDDGVSLGQIRAEMQLLAAKNIADFGIVVPAEYAALLGDGAPGSDGSTLRFGAPGFGPGDVSGDYQLRLSTFPTTAAAPCAEWFSVEPMGYQLVIADQGGERLIHRDGALPRSRGCPVTYRLHGVVLPFNAGSISHAVALISVYPGGFEGPDRRFIAVPLGL
jgi:predicted secreted protein